MTFFRKPESLPQTTLHITFRKTMEYILEFILCGSHAKEILASIKGLKSMPLEDEMYAFRFRSSNLRVDLNSDPSVLNDGEFSIEPFTPDFETDNDKYILLAGKDDDEREKLGKLITSKYGDKNITKLVNIIPWDKENGYDFHTGCYFFMNSRWIEVNFPPVPNSWPIMHKGILSCKEFGETDIQKIFTEAKNKHFDSLRKQVEEQNRPKPTPNSGCCIM